MNIPTQIDRLEVGHIATFIWNTSSQTPCIGSYIVVERLETDRPKTDPPHAAHDWLAPFMGAPVLTMGAVSSPEDNETVMLLVRIGTPVPGAHSFDSVAHAPHWFGRLPSLCLEDIWYSRRRNELLADIPGIFEKLAA